MTTLLALLILAPPEPFPFVLPLDDAGATYLDLSALNPEPAGAKGFVTVRDGRFVDGDGRRIRFLGTNVTFSGALPSHEVASAIARRLRKFGFNIVRFHHIDGGTKPRGLWANREQTGFDPEMLDRLDYFIAQLKANGIYVNLNLHVSRRYPGVRFNDLPYLFRYGKVLDHYHPRLIELQKQYATALLDHTNPYTGARYAAEPAVACIEINNENTLVGRGLSADLLDLPDDLVAPLRDGWQAWVKDRYGSFETAIAAWERGYEKPGDEMLTNGDSVAGTDGWVLEAPAPARATLETMPGAGPDGGPALRARMTQLGRQSWHFQVHQVHLDLENGASYTLEFAARADQSRAISVNTRVDQPDWHSVGLNARIELGPEWQRFRLVFTAANVVPGHSRVSFSLTNKLGTVELADVSLRRGARADLGGATRLAELPIPLSGALDSQLRDWMSYLVDTERRYVETMRRHIKETIGAESVVTHTQASYGDIGGVLRESTLSDYVDMHSYWQHPRFPGRPWDSNNWLIPNTPMVADANGGTLRRMAEHRVAGKPFTVSEYDHPFPSFYSAEMFPLIAGYAAVQDWDAVYQFNYGNSSDNYDQNHVAGYFTLATHPGKMAFAPIAAIMLRGGGVAALDEVTTLEVPRESVPELLASHSGKLSALWAAAGATPGLFTQRRLEVRMVDGEGPPRLAGGAGDQASDGWLAGEATPFRWRPAPAEEAEARIVGDRAVAIVGRIGGRRVAAGPLEVLLAPTERNFASIALASLDGQPIESSSKLVLVACGAIQNQDMGWNDDFTTLGRKWGHGPTMAEALRIEVRIRTAVDGLTVSPLDERGERREAIEARREGRAVSFRVDPSHRTLWYAIARP